MRKPLLLFIFAITCLAGYAQVVKQPKRIKILLLGTFHFNQSLDSNSKLHFSLFTEKRQREIDEVTSRLAAIKPDKIFIEREPSEQPFWDSLYHDYQKGIAPKPVKRNANEIVQLGFRIAHKLSLPKLTCIDFQPENYQDSSFKTPYATEQTVHRLWQQIAAYQDSVRTNAVFFDLKYPYKRPKQDSLLQRSTLSQFLLQINSPASYTYFTWSDWNWFYSLGRKDEYIGTDWLANFWYGRNLRIFSNILRQVNFEKDQTYLVIYGSSHIPFLKHLFETNPYFEVVNVADVLTSNNVKK